MSDETPSATAIESLPPDSPLLLAWDALMVLGATALSILIPLDLVLGVREGRTASMLTNIVTALLVADIGVGFMRTRRSVRGQGFIVVSSGGAYARRWLFIDLLASLPLGAITGVGILEMIRLVKLDKVRVILTEWKLRELRHADELLLGFVLFTMFLATHWITCGWIALRGVAPATPVRTAYVDGLYWTITTLTTVGYGDVVPADSTQKLYAIFTMIVGFSFLGYLIGLLASVWARRDPARQRFRENIEKLATAAKYARLPRSLQRRIYDYHYYVWRQRLGYDEVDFLSELPRNLRSEVSLHMKRHLLERGELFQGADPDFVREISVHLRPFVLTPGDVVFHEGEEGKDMYFIARGQVEVLSAGQQRLALLGEGSYFGEIALLGNVPRTATVRAIDYCDVYSLSRSAFESVVLHHPEVISQIQAKARARSEVTTRGASVQS